MEKLLVPIRNKASTHWKRCFLTLEASCPVGGSGVCLSGGYLKMATVAIIVTMLQMVIRGMQMASMMRSHAGRRF